MFCLWQQCAAEIKEGEGPSFISVWHQGCQIFSAVKCQISQQKEPDLYFYLLKFKKFGAKQ